MLDGSVGYLDNSAQAHDLSRAASSASTTPGAGASTSPARSSADYVRDFHLGPVSIGDDPNLLTSQIYVEGFGEGAYSRLDVRFYQGLNNTIVSSKLPLVLPRYEYSYFGQPDAWGGRFSLDAGAFQRGAHGSAPTRGAPT